MTPKNYKPSDFRSKRQGILPVIGSCILMVFFLIFPLLLSYAGQKNELLQAQVQSLSQKDGLSSNKITSICKDDGGFIWFGTANGLNRYDGKSIKSYKNEPNNLNSLSNNYVKCIYKDGSGNLWIGTNRGLNLFDYETHTFIRPEINNGETPPSVIAMTEDRNRDLWIVTSKGLSHRSFKTGEYRSYGQLYQKPEFTESVITKIHCDSHGDIWLGTWTDGIFRLDPNTGLVTKFSVPGQSNDITNIGQVSAITEGPEGGIWVGSWNFGLMQISADRKSTVLYKHDDNNVNSLNGNKIKSLAFDKSGALWIGTEESGLDRFSPQDGSFTHYFVDFHRSDIYEGASIYSILIDDQSLMWLGFRNDGVKKVPLYSPPFEHFQRPGEESYRVFSFIEGKEGLWLGVRGALEHLDLQTNRFTKYPLPNNETPIAIYQVTDSTLLVGTYKGSIFLYDLYNQAFETFLPGHLRALFIDKKVNSFYHVSPHDVLIGSQAGCFNYNVENQTLKKITQKWVHSILPASKDSYWLVRFDRAIDQYFPDTGRLQTSEFREIGPLKSVAVADGDIFLGTDLGFYKHDLKNDTTYRYKDIFPYQSNQVNAIVQDERKNIWFTSENDLVFFDQKGETFRTFDSEDGLPEMRFRDGVGVGLKNGDLVFGGDGGLIVVNPKAYRPQENTSNLKFSKLLIANKEILADGKKSPLKKDISMTESLTLKYHQNIISLEFGLLSYINPQKHQYRYKMEGTDNQWFDLAGRNSVTFANLPPGDYKLHIQATNEDGIWGAGKSMKITVLPPIWKTWYAYSFYFLCLIAISYLIRKVNINKERLKNKIAMEKVKQENIRKLADQESEFHDMRLRFFTNISHEFRTPLTLILGPLAKFMQRNEHPTGNHLKLMYKNAERLKRLITQILDFRKMEAGDLKFEPTWGDIVRFSLETANLFIPLAQQKPIQFSTHSNTSGRQAWFDKDKLEKIIFNLLSNAFKFTTEGTVSFTVNIHEKQPHAPKTMPLLRGMGQQANFYVEILVTDTGVGIPKKEQVNIFDRFYHLRSEKSGQSGGTGIGLTLTKELVEVHHGAIFVSSEEKKGTEFRVVLPLLNEEKPHGQKDNIQSPNDAYGFFTPQKGDAVVEDKQEGAVVKPVVLLVENNKDLREYMRLEFGGSYTLMEAENGKEGLEKALEHVPDLIISDVMMPEMDGIEFCNSIKTDSLTSHIPVILLTARSSQVHVMQGLETGADDFITKPFSSELLFTRIGNLLKSRKALQIKFSQELRLNPEGLPVASMDQAFLRKAMETVEANLDNSDFSADLFASEMCMSRVHLYRKLKALTNLSVTDFVKNARLKLASNLIRDNKLSIKETAYTVGFKDPKYFSKCFKQQFGVRPSEYYGDVVDN